LSPSTPATQANQDDKPVLDSVACCGEKPPVIEQVHCGFDWRLDETLHLKEVRIRW
jgi:hypothetical protein